LGAEGAVDPLDRLRGLDVFGCLRQRAGFLADGPGLFHAQHTGLRPDRRSGRRLEARDRRRHRFHPGWSTLYHFYFKDDHGNRLSVVLYGLGRADSRHRFFHRHIILSRLAQKGEGALKLLCIFYRI